MRVISFLYTLMYMFSSDERQKYCNQLVTSVVMKGYVQGAETPNY
jgi:hypothetical protein